VDKPPPVSNAVVKEFEEGGKMEIANGRATNPAPPDYGPRGGPS